MEERQVTVSGKRYALPDLFMVLATQNPIEQEGTYPLPEAQMDRFLMYVRIDYPNDADEAKVLRLVRAEQAGTAEAPPPKIEPQSIFDARKEIDAVSMVEAVEDYIVALVAATRRPAEFGDKLKGWIGIGASPRGTLALDRSSRTYAWMQGRDYVTPEDVQAIVHDCLRHRVSLTYEAGADGMRTDDVLDEVVKQVAAAIREEGRLAKAHSADEARAYVTLDELLRLRHRAKGFSFLPKQPVHSLLAGRHASRLRGRGLEFEELRHYYEGDDVRAIDWPATARLGSPRVRVFTEERAPRCCCWWTSGSACSSAAGAP
ncbi:MAG: family ATPase [Microvirga sp.]|nr:family ATPase [Microvirga sp.]